MSAPLRYTHDVQLPEFRWDQVQDRGELTADEAVRAFERFPFEAELRKGEKLAEPTAPTVSFRSLPDEATLSIWSSTPGRFEVFLGTSLGGHTVEATEREWIAARIRDFFAGERQDLMRKLTADSPGAAAPGPQGSRGVRQAGSAGASVGAGASDAPTHSATIWIASAALLLFGALALAHYSGDSARRAGDAAIPERETFAGMKPAVALPQPDNPLRYPASLRERNVEGRVVVEFIVHTNGRADMSSFQVIESSHDEFTDAVRSHLRTMRFLPAEQDGRRVRMHVQMPFNFQLSR